MANPPSPNSKTAAVTGAASGIGKAFCEAFARAGYDLILIDRSPAATEEFAAKLKAAFPNARIDTCVGDLLEPDDLERAAEMVASCATLERLVTAAGFGITANFSDTTFAKQKALIDIHVVASVRMCHAALQTMIPRDSGAIINISSISAFTRFPQTATYCGAKMFLIGFTESLAVELQKMGLRNIKLQALCPGQTRTAFPLSEDMRGFDPNRVPAFLWMTPEALVELSLARLERGSGTYIPHLKNKLYVFVFGNPIVTLLLNFLRKFGILEMALALFRRRKPAQG
jgi:hypothetical protein